METEKMIVAFRHELHENPELSGCETETKQRLMRFIREHTGLAVCDQGKWVYAYYEPEKKLRINAATTAIPVYSHGWRCGLKETLQSGARFI